MTLRILTIFLSMHLKIAKTVQYITMFLKKEKQKINNESSQYQIISYSLSCARISLRSSNNKFEDPGINVGQKM